MNESRRQILLDTPHTETATGAIATFETDMVGRAKEVRVEIEPVQEGTPWIADTTESVPYNFRAVKGTAPRIGNSIFESVVGGTVAWNQNLKTMAQANWSIPRTESCTFSDGVATFVAKAQYGGVQHPNVGIVKDHKYLYGYRFMPTTSNTSIRINVALSGSNMFFSTNTNVANQWTDAYIVQNCGATGIAAYGIQDTRTANWDQIKVKDAMLIDLTQMFGTTVADYIYSLETATHGAGVSWFRKLFPEDYYEYNPGELISVEGVSSHETVGFNQWDEEWETGTVNTSDGTERATSNTIRSKNYCGLIGGKTYYATCGKTDGGNQNRYYIGIIFYDAEKRYISGGYFNNLTFTAPENARYFKLTTNTSTVVYGSTYNHDICINLSDPTRNGTYEPYTKHSYPLDSTLTLRGIPKLDANNQLYYDGDTYESDGTVTRKIKEIEVTACGSVGVASTGARYATYSISPAITELLKNNFLSNAYGFRVNAPNDGGKWFRVASSTLFIFDERFTDKSTADTILAIEKPHFVYELATPTTETATPFQSPQAIDEYGTEEYVYSGTRDVAIPVGHVTRHADIYPISGFGGLTVEARGINVWDEEWELGGINSTTGATDTTTNKIRSKNFISCLPDTSYYVYFGGVGSIGVYFYDNSGNFIKLVGATSKTVTTPSNAYKMKFACSTGYGTTYNRDISINYPATATSYEPYTGSTTPISWADEAGTVYGGTLEWEKDGTVTLTVDRVSVDMGELSWMFMNVNGTQRLCSVSLNPLPLTPKSDYYPPKIICSVYKVVNVSQLPNNLYSVSMGFSGYGYGNRLIVNDETITTVEQAIEKLSGQTCVYQLLTPVTYTLTPTEALVFLRGTNNVWNDINDTSVTYWTHKTGDSV